MKTKIIMSIVALSVVALFVGTNFKSTTVQQNTIKAARSQTPQKTTTTDLLLQFPIVSDVHIGASSNQEQKFTSVLSQYKKIAPNYDAIIADGDITNQGEVYQYDSFMNVFNKNAVSTAQKIITMGNHEYFEAAQNITPSLTDTDMKNRFVQKTGMPGIYFDKWIKGYHFIILSGEESNDTNPNDGDNAILSDTQLTWLQNTIAQDTAANKPIFVFLHQPIDNTVYGSELWGGVKDSRLSDILKQYPQSILFSGHTHYLLSNPKMVYQDGFTMVATGGLLDTWYDGGNNSCSNTV